MASTPISSKACTSNCTPAARLTPSTSFNNPSKTSRTQRKTRSQYAHSLSLRKIIGNTVNNPLCFSCDEASQKIAYSAGATVVVLEGQNNYRQQTFYRAKSTAVTQSFTTTSAFGSPSTSSRIRSNRTSRESEAPATPGSGTSGGQSDSPTSKNWSSREKIKPVTCLSLSPGGQYLAVGEVKFTPIIYISLTDKMSDRIVSLTS